jgi:hypothetical protein
MKGDGCRHITKLANDCAAVRARANQMTTHHEVVGGVIQLPWASMSTFLVEMQFRGTPLSRGTCLTVSHGDHWFVVTNRHNVTGRDQYTNDCLHDMGGVPNQLAIVLPTADLGNEWWVHGIDLYDDQGEPTWSEHPSLGAAVDVVALPFDKPPQGRCFGVHVTEHNDFAVVVGNPVNCIGYRDGEPMFSAFPQWIDCTLETPLDDSWDGRPAFLIRGPTAKGSSGSPVIAYREDAQDLRRSDGSPVGSDWATRFLGIYSGRTPTGAGVVWNLACVRAVVEEAAQKMSSRTD